MIFSPEISYEVTVAQKFKSGKKMKYQFRVTTNTIKFFWRRFRLEAHAVRREVIGDGQHFHWTDTGYNIFPKLDPHLILKLGAAINLFEDQRPREAL